MNTDVSHHSLPLGRFRSRDVCASATEIPYWWRKIYLESGIWSEALIGRRSNSSIVFFSYRLRMTDKGLKVKCEHDESTTKQSIFVEYILLLRELNNWVLLELVRRRTPYFTLIELEKHKIDQIYVWKPTTTELIIVCNINWRHQYGISVAKTSHMRTARSKEGRLDYLFEDVSCPLGS